MVRQAMWKYSVIVMFCLLPHSSFAGGEQFQSAVQTAKTINVYRLQVQADGKAEPGPGVICGWRVGHGPVQIDPVLVEKLVAAFSHYDPASWPPVVLRFECVCQPKLALRFTGESHVADVVLAIEFDHVEFYLDNQRLGTGALGELCVDLAEIAGTCFYEDSVMVSLQRSFGDTTHCAWTALKRHDVEVLQVELREIIGWRATLGLLNDHSESDARAIALEGIQSILRCASSTATETDVYVGTRTHPAGEWLGFAKVHPKDRSLIWFGESSSEEIRSRLKESADVEPARFHQFDGAPFHRFDEPAVLESYAQPEYPEAARQAGVRGTVAVKVLVGIDGKIEDAAVFTASDVVFEAAALAAAYKCTFKPAKWKGQAVKSEVMLPFQFAPDM
jgi:TonB family protein